MKAIIVDRNDRFLIVLDKKGDFIKIYNSIPGCQIGDEVDIPDKMPLFGLFPGGLIAFAPLRKMVAALVAFLLLLGMGGYAIADYFTPVTFVTMDINPSVELALNRYERVLSVNTFNEEGNLLAKDAGSFRNMKVEDAIKKLLDRAEAQNYLKTQGTLMFTVSSVKNHVPDELDRKLKETIKTRPNIKVVVENTTIEKHEEARKMNISQGKLLIYERLKKINPGITLEEIKKSSVSRMMEQLNRPLSDREKNLTEKKDEKKTGSKVPEASKGKSDSNTNGNSTEKMRRKFEKVETPENLNKNNGLKLPDKKSHTNKSSIDIINIEEKKNIDMSDTIEKFKEDAGKKEHKDKNETFREQRDQGRGKEGDRRFFNNYTKGNGK